jgi:hypothetical protein
MFHQVLLWMKEAQSSFSLFGKTAIRIDCNQLDKPTLPPSGSRRVTFGTTQDSFCGFDQHHTLRDWPATRTLRPGLPLVSYPAPRTSLLPPVCTLEKHYTTASKQRRTVFGLSPFTVSQSVDVEIYHQTKLVGVSPIGKNFYRQTTLLLTNSAMEKNHWQTVCYHLCR